MLLVALPSLSITRTRGHVRRAGEVVRILSRYGFAGWVKETAPGWVRRWFSEPDGQLLAEYTAGERLRMAFIELGTTYIKFGQMLSTRADIVGPEIADELTALQASIPADPPDVVRSVLEAELGRPVEEVYAEFDFEALGSASIGQVHVARLHDGTPVVVKVQHAGIERKVRADLAIMRQVAELAERTLSNLPYQPAALLEEFDRQLTRELDLRQEMRNLQRFTANFAAQPSAKFPLTYPELTSAVS